MKYVWIEPAECMGAGTCEQIVPDVFADRGDGLWAVRESAAHFGADVVFDGRQGAGHGPDGEQGRARVPDLLLDDVLDAADECPGECIFVAG